MGDKQIINISSLPLFHLFCKVVWSFWQMGFVRKFLVPIKLLLTRTQAEENDFISRNKKKDSF